VYLGETQTAMAYFESLGYRRPDLVNPADFMMDAIAGTLRPLPACIGTLHMMSST